MIRTLIKISSVLLFALASCEEDDNIDVIVQRPDESNEVVYDPTPVNLQLPDHFILINPPVVPQDNPLTVEGIALGRKLFFEKKLSRNNSISCASCHNPSNAFNDKGKQFSIGVDGNVGIINAMPLFNLAFTDEFNDHGSFNWNGRFNSIEEQNFEPVTNPLEMDETWINVMSKLQNDSDYPDLFYAAFGTRIIDSNLVVKALAQFERTLISGNSKMDNQMKFEAGLPYTGARLNAQEERGYTVYVSENKGDCLHCHGLKPNPIWTDFKFRNNGLDLAPDSGLAAITKLSTDVGKFKTPSLRNLVFTSPYMHDGRFSTLEEVIDFYTDSVQFSSPNVDPTMQKTRNLTTLEKQDLLAFLRAITDSVFVNQAEFQEP